MAHTSYGSTINPAAVVAESQSNVIESQHSKTKRTTYHFTNASVVIHSALLWVEISFKNLRLKLIVS